MISSIVWVPAGVANPNPQRYEMSAQELELLRLLEQEEAQNGDAQPSADDNAGAFQTSRQRRGGLHVKAVASPDPAAANLPADLRMDEYSSDEDQGKELARIIGMPTGGDEGPPVDQDEQDDNDDENNESNASDDDAMDEMNPMKVDRDSEEDGDGDDDDAVDNESDGEDDSDDDLADVPDTREFEPVDVEGLQAMGLNQIGNSALHMDGLGEEEDDDSEVENVRISETDAIVLVAKTEEDFAGIEVHVYDQRRGNLYVHHDIPLSSYPLCLAHGRVRDGGILGNFCAVGTFGPGIEIWNLDVLNALEPVCVLGGEDTSAMDEMLKRQMLGEGGRDRRLPGPPKGNEGISLRPGSHTEAVMSLSWNTIHQQVIASGSADHTVKLWDVTKAGSSDSDQPCNASTFSHHGDKVNAVEWHPTESTLLATGSFDRTVALLDARTDGTNAKRVKLPSDCEALAWDPFHPEYLTVATEDGTLLCWDVRKFDTRSPSWSVSPKDEFGGGLNDLSYNPHVPGMLATCSVDSTVTLWDTYHRSDDGGDGEALRPHAAAPRVCLNKAMASGKLYAVQFYPSAQFLLGCGGSGKELSLWHTDSEAKVLEWFGGRPASVGRSATTVAPREADFEAMMAAAADQPTPRPTDDAPPKSHTKKKRGAKKKKAHKRR